MTEIWIHLDILQYFLGMYSSSIIQDILTILLMVIKLIKINNKEMQNLQNHGSQPILVADVPQRGSVLILSDRR